MREELPRASAVIIASRPPEQDDTVASVGDERQVLPALVRVGTISLIERDYPTSDGRCRSIVVITGLERKTEKHLAKMNVVNLYSPYWRERRLVTTRSRVCLISKDMLWVPFGGASHSVRSRHL